MKKRRKYLGNTLHSNLHYSENLEQNVHWIAFQSQAIALLLAKLIKIMLNLTHNKDIKDYVHLRIYI